MAEPKKILCPDVDCNTENDSTSESCTKCGLDFASFFTLDRAMSVREKAKAKAEADKKSSDEKNKSTPKPGLASLWGKK